MKAPDEEFVSNVLKRISARSWKSNRRRSYLERLATLAVGSKVRVQFTDISTAACEWKEDAGYHRIQLRSEELETYYVSKYSNSMGEGTVHTLTQEGFLYHELGHVLITDFDAWMSALDEISSLKKKAMAKQILNAVEDVVLEAWIRDYFNCGKILDFKNEVKFHTLYRVKHSQPKQAAKFYDAHTDDKFDALLWAVETQGRYDAGIDWDEVEIPQEPGDATTNARSVATEMISDAVTEPDPEKRYLGIIDKFSDYIDARTDNESEQFTKEDHKGGQQASQQQIQMMVPSQGDDEENDDSGSQSGSSEEREPRTVEEILDGRDTDEVKVVM